MSDTLKHDLHAVKDTFALSSVPKESYALGLAGTIPYIFTSASTVYLSWVLNTPWPSSSAFLNNIMISHESASYWMSIIEPMQLGYGAVIIGFLGAIHWGLEYAEKKPSYERTRFRYGLGVLASTAAVPTLFMPWQWALTSQFGIFVGMYFADASATTRGWAPSWYVTYRFVLTAVVGTAIVISLIGRSKAGDAAAQLSGSKLGQSFHQHAGEQKYDAKWERREYEDKEKAKKEAEEAEKEIKAEEKNEKEAKSEKRGDDSDKGNDKQEKKGDKDGKKGKEKQDNKKSDDVDEEQDKQDDEGINSGGKEQDNQDDKGVDDRAKGKEKQKK